VRGRRSTNVEIMSLHRYFNLVRRDARVMEQIGERHGSAVEPRSQVGIRFFHCMYYWYAGLYVVIEGWCALGLHDPAVDIREPMASRARIE